MIRTARDVEALRAAIADPVQVELLNHWLSIRGPRRMPTRRDVVPERMPRRILPHVGLIDVLPDGKFRYRLVGTAMNRLYRRDYTGTIVDQSKAPDYAMPLIGLYRTCVERRAIAYAEARSRYRQGPERLGYRLLLPLSDDGDDVDMILFSTIAAPAASVHETLRFADLGGDDIVAIEPDFEILVLAV